MRALRIEMDGVAEVELPDDFLETGDVIWDCLPFDDRHDLWVDDAGLLSGTPEIAHVGDNASVPLPAYVLGNAGDATVGATLSAREVDERVSDRRSPGALAFSARSEQGEGRR